MIESTAGYAEALLVALLPYVSDFATRLNLDVPLPVTSSQVQVFRPFQSDPGGQITHTNGMVFHVWRGRVRTYRTALYDRTLRGHSPVVERIQLTRAQAVETVRRSLTALGYDLEDLNADVEPKVMDPGRAWGRLLAFYHIEWFKINQVGRTMLSAVVNGDTGVIEALSLIAVSEGPPPKLSVGPPPSAKQNEGEPFTDSEKAELLQAVLPQFDSIVQRLALPISVPVTSAHLRELHAGWRDRGKAMNYAITLTNGYDFSGTSKGIEGWASPDAFFGVHRVRAKDFVGPEKLSRRQAIALAREAVRKLGYGEDVLSCRGSPTEDRPTLFGLQNIPRRSYTWDAERSGWFSHVSAEIDLQRGRVTRLNFTGSKLRYDLPKRESRPAP